MRNGFNESLGSLDGPVMITGHTGFKGTWMSLLLQRLGVSVIGYSLEPKINSLFRRAGLLGRFTETFDDIRNYKKLEEFISIHKPSVVVHMAAQSLVLKSYDQPRDTFDVNVMGTVNLLDICSKKDFIKIILVVTSDKVYKNFEDKNYFLESDQLEGRDPYSASKVATEAVVAAWQQIYLHSSGTKLVSVRAGNVIGGGDFSENRIIPDIVRSILDQTKLVVRNPKSARPWQHVLDVIFGYRLLLDELLKNKTIKCMNFGPSETENLKVDEIVSIAREYFPAIEIDVSRHELDQTERKYEATDIKLNSNYAYKVLNWENSFTQVQAVKATFNWWRTYLNHQDALEAVILDIDGYLANKQLI